MTDNALPPPPVARPRPRFLATRGARFAIMILLTVLMTVPLFMVVIVIEERSSFSRQAIHEVSQRWGGPIFLSGPSLVVPVEKELTRTVKDDDGNEIEEVYTARSEPVILLPELLTVDADGRSQIRKRGIFEIPVFSAELKMSFSFDTSRIDDVLGSRETLLWDRASLVVQMPGTRSFSGTTALNSGARAFDLEPGTPFARVAGIQAKTGDPRTLGIMTLEMGLNGAESLFFAPVGRQTDVTITSDWPHPSFDGSFLPKERQVTDEGFAATWQIPHLAREIAQVSRTHVQNAASFGVRFYNPVDFYQKAGRAAKYGILFIALTFLTVFLIERFAPRPVHAAQLVLIGVAQCIFFLLLLSFAEQLGFDAAYLAASAATVGLITIYGAVGLALRRMTAALFAALATLYSVLYLILQSTDYALLAGSVLAFVAVALAMFMTKGDGWGDDWADGQSQPSAAS
ncbi:MAG: cell envelope integrity protein CreD [Pseudomonadota bacterium]